MWCQVCPWCLRRVGSRPRGSGGGFRERWVGSWVNWCSFHPQNHLKWDVYYWLLLFKSLPRLFSIIHGIILPNWLIFFQRGRYTTNQLLYKPLSNGIIMGLFLGESTVLWFTFVGMTGPQFLEIVINYHQWCLWGPGCGRRHINFETPCCSVVPVLPYSTLW